MLRNNDDAGKFDERRLNRARMRQEKWEKRQERSKLSREEIDLLQLKRADLRSRLDEREAAKDAEIGAAHHGQPVSALREDGVAADNDEEEQFVYFNNLPLSERTKMGLERGNYKKMTPIQRDSLHLALAGYDVLGAAKTGSGKTLCFVVPVLERLFVEHWDAEMGIGAITLSPTRELALQIFKVMQVVGYKHVLSAALLTGGRDVQEERKRLHAISIIVGTPGRILHHLQDDSTLVLDNLQLLCMDEADRLLDMGFRDTMTNILKYLPPQRQTLLFSATQTTDVKMLAEMSLHSPRYVTSQAVTTSPTPSTLCQNFLVVELHRKLDVLLMFLKKHPNDKIVVFVSTCNQAKYMYLAFSKVLKKMRIPSMCLTSKMKQFRREEVFLTFCRCKSAVLFCTDVAARGLDFPLVHWVVQYDCPDSAQTYIHRAGRTARAGAKGVSLLLLTPRETPMLSYLANKHVVMREVAIRSGLMHVSQEIFVALVVQGLKYEAQKAFIAYLRSVYFASNKHVFDVTSIDVEAFAKSLGLLVVPDMSELQNLQRSAKNLPWDVLNYIAKRERANASRASKQVAMAAHEDGSGAESDASDSGDAAPQERQLTRKEKHLHASDMFRMLQQKQKFVPKNGGAFAAGNDDDDDDFLVKKEKSSGPADGQRTGSAGPASSDAHLRLTIDERLAGLSKSKRRKYLETPDVRVRDLGLTTRVIYSSDDEPDDADEPRGVAPRQASAPLAGQARTRAGSSDAAGESGSGEEEVDEDVFAERLRERMGGTKTTDADRAKKLRRLRKLQKTGKLSRKQTLTSSGVSGAAKGGPRPARNSEEDEEDAGYASSNEYADTSDDDGENAGSLARLIKAAKGELYPEAEDHDDELTDGESEVDDARSGANVYHGMDSSEDNDSDTHEDPAPPAKKAKTRRG